MIVSVLLIHTFIAMTEQKCEQYWSLGIKDRCASSGLPGIIALLSLSLSFLISHKRRIQYFESTPQVRESLIDSDNKFSFIQ